MELNASRKFVLEAMDKKQEFQQLLFVNVVAIVLSILLFMAIDGNIMILALLSFVLIYGVCCCNREIKEETKKITDLTNSRLSLDDEWFKCIQTAENDTYEECFIRLTEIKKVIRAKEEGVCGFYVYLTDNAKKSSLYVNRSQVERNLFFVNGFGYSYDDFVEFYEQFTAKLPDDTETAGIGGYNSWKEKPMKLFYVKIASPFIFVYVMAFVQVLILLARM